MKRFLTVVVLVAGALLATGATVATASLDMIQFNDTAWLDTSQVIDLREG